MLFKNLYSTSCQCTRIRITCRLWGKVCIGYCFEVMGIYRGDRLPDVSQVHKSNCEEWKVGVKLRVYSCYINVYASK